MSAPPVPPLRMSLLVPLSPEEAFDLFTSRMSEWWPLEHHSVSKDRAAGCFVERFEGGRVYERRLDGGEHEWGKVLAFEPHRRLVMSWNPSGGPATEVEVTFTPADDGTFVELEHRGWEALGELAEKVRGDYANGWPVVFTERFGRAAGVP